MIGATEATLKIRLKMLGTDLLGSVVRAYYLDDTISETVRDTEILPG